MTMLVPTVRSVTEIGKDTKLRLSCEIFYNTREVWGQYECHYSCEDCDPATSCKEGMTCYNDYLFVEFLIQNLLAEFKIDQTRIHASGLSNGAQD